MGDLNSVISEYQKLTNMKLDNLALSELEKEHLTYTISTFGCMKAGKSTLNAALVGMV